jgi:uncharacterized membrane protein YgdD (TMEM256/DUF423 family)
MTRLFFACGSLSGGLVVVLGAFGAHTLEARMTPETLATFETAVRYQMYHALVLLVVGVACERRSASRLLVTAGWLFVVGIVLFSGSLYALILTGLHWLGAITPVGGLSFIVGWMCLFVVSLRELPFPREIHQCRTRDPGDGNRGG